MDKIKLNTAEGQAALAALGTGVQVTLHGIISMAKYMTKPLEGEELKQDCDYLMSRGVRQPNREPRYRFSITNVEMILQNSQMMNAAEQYVWQSVYMDKENRPTKVVEMGKKEFIENRINWGGTLFGYKGADGQIYPVNILGTNIANGQGVTVTFSTYQQKNGDFSVGFDYVVFDAEPQFFVPQSHNIPQGWVQAPIKTYGAVETAPAQVAQPVAAAPAPQMTAPTPVAAAPAPMAAAPAPTPAPMPTQAAAPAPAPVAATPVAPAPAPAPAPMPTQMATPAPAPAPAATPVAAAPAPATAGIVPPAPAAAAPAPGFTPAPQVNAASAWT